MIGEVTEGVCRKTTLLLGTVTAGVMTGAMTGALLASMNPLPCFWEDGSDCFAAEANSSSDDDVDEGVADGAADTGVTAVDDDVNGWRGDHDPDPNEAMDILDGVTRGVDVLAVVAGGLSVVDSDDVKEEEEEVDATAGSLERRVRDGDDDVTGGGTGTDNCSGDSGEGGVAMGMSLMTRWLAGASEVFPPTGRFSCKTKNAKRTN